MGCAKTIDNTGTCSDGIKNQGEQGVDCGGPCPGSCPNCADGIHNQGETGVDCGGPCSPCFPRMVATVDGNAWTSTSRNAFLSGPYSITIFGTDLNSTITITYSGTFKTGTYTTSNVFSCEYRDSNGTLFQSGSESKLTIIELDTIQRKITAAYNFKAIDPLTGDVKDITNGFFNVLEY